MFKFNEVGESKTALRKSLDNEHQINDHVCSKVKQWNDKTGNQTARQSVPESHVNKIPGQPPDDGKSLEMAEKKKIKV